MSPPTDFESVTSAIPSFRQDAGFIIDDYGVKSKGSGEISLLFTAEFPVGEGKVPDMDPSLRIRRGARFIRHGLKWGARAARIDFFVSLPKSCNLMGMSASKERTG